MKISVFIILMILFNLTSCKLEEQLGNKDDDHDKDEREFDHDEDHDENHENVIISNCLIQFDSDTGVADTHCLEASGINQAFCDQFANFILSNDNFNYRATTITNSFNDSTNCPVNADVLTSRDIGGTEQNTFESKTSLGNCSLNLLGEDIVLNFYGGVLTTTSAQQTNCNNIGGFWVSF